MFFLVRVGGGGREVEGGEGVRTRFLNPMLEFPVTILTTSSPLSSSFFTVGVGRSSSPSLLAGGSSLTPSRILLKTSSIPLLSPPSFLHPSTVTHPSTTTCLATFVGTH